MKRAYSSSAYARPCEQYCREHYPEEAAQIFRRAEDYYRQFQKDMPDLGKNVMAQNMLDWFTILSFYEATGRRMDGEVLLEIKRRAVDKWKFLGKFIDGNRNQGIELQNEMVVHGDARSASIAAASILAKVSRDRFMVELAEQYPQYAFEKHKGYPTKLHYQLLRQYGPSPVHRKTFLKKL